MSIDTVAQRAALAGARADIWTAMPGIVEAYDIAEQTVSVQCAIQAQTQDKTTGKWSDVNLPLLIHVPVLFPRGGDFAMTFPIKKGDEGLVVFCSRCIDAFWQQGGVQKQVESRMHDLSDGIFIPGSLSQPKKLENVNADAVQLRSADGQTVVEVAAAKISLTPDAGTTKLEIEPTFIKVTGQLIVTGDFQLGGAFEAEAGGGAPYAHDLKVTGDVIGGFGTGDQVGLKTHRHTQPNDTHGDGESPTNAPTAGT